MTGTEQAAFSTDLNSGNEIPSTFFFQSLNMQKNILEQKRDWMILRAFDSSISFASSDGYDSTKNLPTRFSRIYTPFSDRGQQQPGVYLVDTNGNKFPLNPCSFASRFDKKDQEGYYYLDMKNGTIGRTGNRAGTLHLFFIQNTEDIDADRTWEFPDYAHPLLPYLVTISYKGGVDYDTVNASQIPSNKVDVNAIMSALNMWDAQLQLQEIGV